MTGMEANLRFAGPETMETKNLRAAVPPGKKLDLPAPPNAVGSQGALTLYGKQSNPVFDMNRT